MANPSLKLKHFISWRSSALPLDWNRVFDSPGPLVLEVGCGNGEVLLRRAKANPHERLVGLDMDWPTVRRALDRLYKNKADNARVLQADAVTTLRYMFEPRSIDQAVCYFPCPWPKEKHADRRLFKTSWLRLLNSRLKEEGGFLLITDWQPLLEWVLTQVPGSGFKANWREIPPGLESKYERKWRGQGQQSFFEITFVKTKQVDIPGFKEFDLQFPYLDELKPERLAAFNQDEDGVYCKDFVYDPEKKKAVLSMVALDEDLSQNFYLEIRPKGDNGPWQVRPGKYCGIVPSKGVQKALDIVKARLAG